MFFDCSALLLGLAASLVTKWKPNDRFTYGFGRAEILAGLANGLFLLFIALFIMKEAIERTFEPPEVHHERLFVISVLGFIVNLVGIFVFQHGGQGHHHGSGGCSHSHSNAHPQHNQHHHHHHHHDHNSHGYNHFSSPAATVNDNHQIRSQAIALDMNQSFNRNNGQTTHQTHYGDHFSHGHELPADHHHPHEIQHGFYDQQGAYDSQPLMDAPVKPRSNSRGQIMQSVFLHIVADTLGSIGVMISAALMSQYGWMIADPICSILIAALIAVSVFPLLKESFYVLMQRIPVELEDKLPACLNKIQCLNGVISIQETHVWTLNSDIYVGCLKLEVSQGADHNFVLANTRSLLTQLGIEQLNIQVDYV